MDTDFVPLGEGHLRSILDAVVQEGDAAEYVGLEAKRDVDLRTKGAGVAKVAKFILGMANRMPEVAAHYFKGYGVMVIGAEKGQAPGVAQGTEPHELADLLRPYLGPDGPRWDLARLPVSDQREVVFVLVEPPSAGQPPYPCHKDYQPADRIDAKAALADGDIYVRDRSQTRKARSSDILGLVSRARRSQEPDLEVTLGVQGRALFVADSKSLRSVWIESSAQKYRKSRESEESAALGKGGSSILSLAPLSSLSFQGAGQNLTVEEQIREFETRVNTEWPKCMDLLAAATADRITFTIENTAQSYLGSPQLIVTIRAARVLSAQNPDEVERDKILPPVEARGDYLAALNTGIRGIRPIGRRMETEWKNTPDGSVCIVLTPDALRPATPWASGVDEFVILSTDPQATELEIEWSLTAGGSGKKLEGRATLPVRCEDARVLLHDFVRMK